MSDDVFGYFNTTHKCDIEIIVRAYRTLHSVYRETTYDIAMPNTCN